MNIVLTDDALKWFHDEMETEPSDTIRFYARYGGSSKFHEAFSLGMNREEPVNPSVKVVKNDVLFFIEDNDVWFFNDHDLHVSVDNDLYELKYDYIKA